MLEAAKYSCTKRDSRSESPLPSDLRILSTTCCLSGPRSHRQTLAVAPLPSGLIGVKPWMPAALSTESASARRLASARAIMLGLSTGGSGRVSARLSWRMGLMSAAGEEVEGLGSRFGGSGGALTSISAGGLWRETSAGTRTIFGKLGLVRSSESHSSPSRRRYSSSISMCE